MANGIHCGPNTPQFLISEADPLLDTAGEDRLIGTADDLAGGDSLFQT